MTPDEFEQKIKELSKAFKDYFDAVAPVVVGTIAVSYYKQNFQNEAWGRQKWQEVKRRTPGTQAYEYNKKKHPARTSRKILSGDTGDLGRSIEVKEQNENKVIVWTDPAAFSSQPYGRVHNEGLRSGRGTGFIMPRRQFIGYTEDLGDLIIEELQKKLEQKAEEAL